MGYNFKWLEYSDRTTGKEEVGSGPKYYPNIGQKRLKKIRVKVILQLTVSLSVLVSNPILGS